MPALPVLDLDLARSATTTRLTEKYQDRVAPETIERYVNHAYRVTDKSARIKNFVALMAEKTATQQVRALAKLAGHRDGIVDVLFACGHNSGRSQMALGFLRAADLSHVTGWAIGQSPSSTLNPMAVDAMAEVGIDIHDEITSPWSPEVVQAADHVICFDADIALPAASATQHLWQEPHISHLPIQQVREVRDDLKSHVDKLVADLR